MGKTIEYVQYGLYAVSVVLILIGLIIIVISFTSSDADKATTQRSNGMIMVVVGVISYFVGCMVGGGDAYSCTQSLPRIVGRGIWW